MSAGGGGAINVRTEVYGRVVEWDASDGRRYMWAVDRKWVQDVGHAQELIEMSADLRSMEPLLGTSDFLTASAKPADLIRVLDPLELTDADLIAKRDELVAEARHWQAGFERIKAERAAAAQSGGCLTACICMLFVAGIVSLIALAL